MSGMIQNILQSSTLQKGKRKRKGSSWSDAPPPNTPAAGRAYATSTLLKWAVKQKQLILYLLQVSQLSLQLICYSKGEAIDSIESPGQHVYTRKKSQVANLSGCQLCLPSSPQARLISIGCIIAFLEPRRRSSYGIVKDRWNRVAMGQRRDGSVLH